MESFKGQFTSAVSSIEESAVKSFTKMAGVSKEFIVGLGVGVGAVTALGAAMFELANKAAEVGAKMFEAHEKTGLTTESLSGINAIAKLTGESFDGLTVALARAGVNLEKAIINPGTSSGKVLAGVMGSTRALTELGLKPMDERMQTVLKRIFELNDGGQRNTALQALMGKGWMQNVETLKYLAEQGFGPAIEQAKKFGLFFDAEAAQRAKEFQVAWKDVKGELESLALIMGAKLLPAITDVTKGWMTLLAVVRDLGTWKGIKGIFLELASNMVDPIVHGFARLEEVFNGFEKSTIDKMKNWSLEPKEYAAAWSKASGQVVATIKAITAETDKMGALDLNRGLSAKKLAEEIKKSEELLFKARQAGAKGLEEVYKYENAEQNRHAESWVKAQKRILAADKEVAKEERADAEFHVQMLRLSQTASKVWSQALIQDMRQVRQEFSQDMRVQETEIKNVIQLEKQQAQQRKRDQQEFLSITSSIIQAFGQQSAAAKVAVAAEAAIRMAFMIAKGLQDMATPGMEWAAVLDFASAAEYGIAAGMNIAGGGGGGGGGGSYGRNPAPAAMDQGPSPMAPGRGGPGGYQGGPATVMIIGGPAAVSHLTKVISQGVQFSGNQLYASHST